MKKSAKILSIILALVMILSAIPVATFAADDDFVINESGVLTAYNGAGGDIVIPDGVTAISSGVFYGNTSITSVKFPSSVKTIGYAAFRDCTNLQTVTFSEGLELLDEEAFEWCSKIQSLELPSSLRTIKRVALYGINGIETLEIPEGVTTIEFGALGNFANLVSISFPASATSIGDDLFSDCNKLVSVTVAPDNPVYDSRDNCNAIIETATNTLIDGCMGTVIPESVTSLGRNAFFELPELKSITLPDSITSIGTCAFMNCSALESITIPDSVTSIGERAFAYDAKLTSVTLHDGITSIGENAFNNYGMLKTVYYPCDDNVATIEGFMSPHGTFTYTPIHDEITYTDNGDGTHTGACTCCSFETEKEAHNFVDGICTLCGAKEGFKTIREILDTVPDFPKNEEDGWTNENGAKVYLIFEGVWQIVFPDMQSSVNNVVVKSGDNYYESYVPDTIYVTKDGVLDCIIVSRSVEGDLNGTYRPACKHPNAYTVPEKAVTCTEDGHSAYLYCPDCDEALEVYDVYVALNHAYAEDVDGKAATCTEDGLTDGKYCPDCDTWIVPQEKIPATNHPNAYNENGEAETCSSSGVTPGVYCPDCDKYISGHETIDPHPHSITDEYIDNEDGTHSQFCEECGEPITVSEHTFVNGVCVCGAKESLTILDVISTNKDFPTDIANAWLNEDGSTLIYKTDTNIILFATATGDNTSTIGTDCTVDEDGDNYKFLNYFIFNMEDGVLKSVSMIDQYSRLKGTYAPHTHAYTDSYVDNGDGTHTGSCACGAVNPEKEAHTFVDGVCVCGAKEVKEPEIISITEKSDAIIGELVDLEVLISKPVKKLVFVDAKGNTYTYGTTSANTVSVVNNDDGTQVWTVKLTVRHSADEYTVKVKEKSSGSWSEKTYDLNIEGKKPPVYDEIISVEVPDEANNEIKYGTHDVVITTGKDVSRVQIAYAGTTATYSKSSSKVTVEEDGDTLVWTISFNFFKNDLITYDFSSRSSTGSWKAFGESKVIYTYKKTSEMK